MEFANGVKLFFRFHIMFVAGFYDIRHTVGVRRSTNSDVPQDPIVDHPKTERLRGYGAFPITLGSASGIGLFQSGHADAKCQMMRHGLA